MTDGLFKKLSPEQQAAALAFDGNPDFGPPMTDLTQAIALMRRVCAAEGPWEAEDFVRSDDLAKGLQPGPVDKAEATILNAVASGELIPLAEVRAFTVSDGQRLLQKRDVAGVCDDPDLCFENVGSTARCGPCAAKLAAKAGIELNQYTASNPQAMRLQRELAATQAKLARVVEALTESVEVVHKAYVSATMEAVNAGHSHPLIRNMDAWRVRCMKAETHARAALEGAKP